MSGPHFLAMEQILIDRLRAVLPAQVHVLSAADLATVTESAQLTPAVHVLYRGYRRGKPTPSMWVEISQQWMTVVAVRNVRDVATGSAARLEAGPLITQVIAALDRYQPGGECQSLHLDDAPSAGYRAGYGYFPLGWRVDMKIRALPGSRNT